MPIDAVKDSEIINYDTLLEFWAEEYIHTHKKFPHATIKFRHKIDIVNDIKKLRQLKQKGQSDE